MKKRRTLEGTTDAHAPDGTPLHGRLRSGSGGAPVNADGSVSVVRADEDASNSGVLDLSPALPSLAETNRGACTPLLAAQDARPVQPPPVAAKTRARTRVPSDSWTTPFAQLHLPPADTTSSEESNGSVVIHGSSSESFAGEGADGARAGFATRSADSPTIGSAPPMGSAARGGDGPHTDPVRAFGAGPRSADDPDMRLAARLRRWMHDAMKQHLYETAIFWGQQAVALEPTELAYNDSYWLAQAYFLTHQYARAEQLLTTPLRWGGGERDAARGARGSADADAGGTPPTQCAAPLHSDALHVALEATRAQSILPASIRGGPAPTARGTSPGDDAADVLHVDSLLGGGGGGGARRVSRRRKRASSADDPFRGAAPADMLPAGVERAQLLAAGAAPRGPCLVNWSSPCRYLAAQCLVRLGKFHDALELTGEDHTRWTAGNTSSTRMPALDGGLKLGSSVCHLRGQIYMRLEETAKAKEAFVLALALDVKNYDSFSALVDGQLLGGDEQWDFVQGLEYVAQAGRDADTQEALAWVRSMYTLRLAKHTASHARRAAAARQAVWRRHAAMASHPDVLYSLADELYANMQYEDAYAVTRRILELDPSYMLSLPVHIACMYYLPHLRPALFLLAHHLTERDPDSCEAWYAVGVWYASAARWAEARRYFSKSSLLDPRFAPSWIAFGHSFALEGESDQAVTAYATAARKFQFSGFPRLFIGMEHLVQGNKNLATLFLDSSADELGSDPLCANERGVAAFQCGRIPAAIDFFRAAIAAAAATQQPASAWVSVHLNLGLAYRRLHRLADARASLMQVIEFDPSCSTAYIALGMCAHAERSFADAIGWYHEGLGIDPRDPVGTELLTMALDTRVAQGLPDALLGAVGEGGLGGGDPTCAGDAGGDGTRCSGADDSAGARAGPPPPHGRDKRSGHAAPSPRDSREGRWRGSAIGRQEARAAAGAAPGDASLSDASASMPMEESQ
ncbi:anaphase-promoting complex subunit Cut9 [Malassezia sp. CBS 17886]|nr:anaphase-promoting complex subunit Cut9 [Malassezia sp. CBS 17886]